MLHKIHTVIVGGGQAGLAISYYLSQERREHVVLEREPAVANAWRNQRWDSFTLVTPNFQVRMPGAEYSGDDPYGFMSLAEVVEYFDNYIERFRLLKEALGRGHLVTAIVRHPEKLEKREGLTAKAGEVYDAASNDVKRGDDCLQADFPLLIAGIQITSR